MTAALEISVTAPVVSFRNPLYPGCRSGCRARRRPPSAGSWPQPPAAGARMPPDTRFAMTFTARGSGSDLETYHPLDARGSGELIPPRRTASSSPMRHPHDLAHRGPGPVGDGAAPAGMATAAGPQPGPGLCPDAQRRAGRRTRPAGAGRGSRRPDRCGDAAAASDRDCRGPLAHPLGRLPVCRDPRGCHHRCRSTSPRPGRRSPSCRQPTPAASTKAACGEGTGKRVGEKPRESW